MKNPFEQLSGTITLRKIAEAGFQEKHFNTGEIQLNYVVGPNNGDPLVLLPAQIGMWESYAKVMLPLSKHFHVYVVDIRGHRVTVEGGFPQTLRLLLKCCMPIGRDTRSMGSLAQ